MSEKSGLEMLEEIIKRLDVIDKRINVLDMTFKTIANSVRAAPTKQEPKAKPIIQAAEPPIAKPKTIMIEGNLSVMKEGKAIPLSGMSIKIYDEWDRLVKETKTNRAGSWVAHLDRKNHGKYVALIEGNFENKRLVPQNKVFEIPENMPEEQTKIVVK